MGVTCMLSMSREMKEARPILSQKGRPCYGIKDRGILEKRAFEHYTIKVWLKVCLITLSSKIPIWCYKSKEDIRVDTQ
jgi:hypothetical protein